MERVSISRSTVTITSVLLVVGGLSSLGSIVLALRRDLAQTVSRLEELQAEARVRDAEFEDLQARLGEVGRQLVDVRTLEEEARAHLLAEIEARKAQEAQVINSELSSLEERVRALRQAAEEHASLLAAVREDSDVEARYRELMSPTVRVNGTYEVGSGSILWSRADPGGAARTYVVTAFHVVQDNHESGDALEIDFYENGDQVRTERGKIVAVEERLDLALVEVRGRHVYPQKARLPDRAALKRLRIFSPVYAIGCPLGYPPMPTSGELTSRHKELDGVHYWMINAPTIFGNSGGGIYLADGHVLIGVLSRISAYKSTIDVAVPHMGLVMPLDRVYDWLDATDYAFVYRDTLAEQRSASAAEVEDEGAARRTGAVPASAPGDARPPLEAGGDAPPAAGLEEAAVAEGQQRPPPSDGGAAPAPEPPTSD